MQAKADDAGPLLARRRSDALQALRDALIGLDGFFVSETSRDAQLHIEITDVLGLDDGPIVRSARRSSRIPERHRVLIVRLIDNGETLDLVCRDRLEITAEHQVADRIHAWARAKQKREGVAQQVTLVQADNPPAAQVAGDS
jgi:hypothetical protein